MLVRDFMEERGLDDDGLAALLDKEPRGVRGMKNREIPRSWADKLGVPFDAEAAAAERERFTTKPKREAETEAPRPHSPDAVKDAPRPPAADLAVKDASVAEERIASLYGGIGFALSARTGNDGYSAVMDDSAPAIARAWVRAAEENELARRVVAMMSSGGATGELVMAHAMMVMGLAYVSGRSNLDPLGGYARKYGRYRPVVPVDAGDGDWQTAPDGAGDGYAGSEASLG